MLTELAIGAYGVELTVGFVTIEEAVPVPLLFIAETRKS